jgi:hypothetical protein
MTVLCPALSDDLFFQFRTGGSVNATNYNFVMHGLSSAGSAGSSYANGSTSAKLIDVNIAATVTRNACTFDIMGPYENDYTLITGSSQSYVSGANYYNLNFGCTHDVTGQRDGFTLLPNSGTFNYKVRLYGYNDG